MTPLPLQHVGHASYEQVNLAGPGLEMQKPTPKTSVKFPEIPRAHLKKRPRNPRAYLKDKRLIKSSRVMEGEGSFVCNRLKCQRLCFQAAGTRGHSEVKATTNAFVTCCVLVGHVLSTHPF